MNSSPFANIAAIEWVDIYCIDCSIGSVGADYVLDTCGWTSSSGWTGPQAMHMQRRELVEVGGSCFGEKGAPLMIRSFYLLL